VRTLFLELTIDCTANYAIAQNFFEIFRSRIDNADLNFTLDTPGRFSLKSSERVLKDNHAFN
jgi:hypothetical protein